MTVYGLHASHEQIPPGALLDAVIRAEQAALSIAHDQWRSNVFGPPVCWDLEMVDHVDEASRKVTPGQVAEVVRVSADLGRHAADPWRARHATGQRREGQ